jgi:citrate lyase subunit beta/citryl-CoA lyase
MIEKAVASEADVAFLDLEDAVAPDQKAASRQNVVRAFKDLDWGRKPPAYRVNGVDTQYFHRDLIEVVEEAGDAVRLIIVPKVGRAEDVAAVDILLRGIEQAVGLEPGHIGLEAQIETARGLVQVEDIVSASVRLEALNFGPGDFSSDMRMPMTSIGGRDRWDEQYPGHRYHYAMSRLVVAARAARLRAIDGPMADFRDLDGFRQSCMIARSLGYDGKWCIHPGQIAIANEVFSPSEEEIAWARRVIEAYTQAVEAGLGAMSLDGRMIDGASIRLAEMTLAGLEDTEREHGT